MRGQMIDGNAQSQPLQSTALEAAVAITRSRPVALVSVIFPALRVILSFRLLRSVFRRENLRRFCDAAPGTTCGNHRAP